MSITKDISAALCFAVPEEQHAFVEEEEVDLTPLCEAIIANDTLAVERLIQMGHDANEKLDNDRSAIFIAAEFGYTSLVSLLLHYGANVNEKDIWGLTPLHAACFFHHTETVQLLLSKKADIHAYSELGTPILAAIGKWTHPRRKNDPFSVVSVLIKHGANVNDKWKRDGYEFVPLIFAIHEKNVKLVNLLIQAKADVNYKQMYKTDPYVQGQAPKETPKEPLFGLVIQAGVEEIIQSFLKVKSLDLTLTGVNLFTALHHACMIGNLGLVKVLVDRKVNINVLAYDGNTPLICALLKGYFHVAEYLLQQNGIDVNQQNNIGLLPLHTALLFKDDLPPGFEFKIVDKVLKTLIDRTKNLDTEAGPFRTTALNHAIVFRDLPLLKYLVQKGAKVNLTEKQKELGTTKGMYLDPPLQMACKSKNNIEIVRLLLSKGADVNCHHHREEEHDQPLYIAICTGDFEIVRELQKYGAEVSNKSVIQNTSIAKETSSETELAERKQINDLLRLNLLLLKNVRLNKCKEVKENIKDGACVNVSHAVLGSPLIYSSWKDYEKIVDVLLENGANVNFKSRSGFTSLHMACKFHMHGRIALKLLLHGAQYNITDNKYKKSPLQYASNNKGTHDLLKLIDGSFENMQNGRLDKANYFINIITSMYGDETFDRMRQNVKNSSGKTLHDVTKEFLLQNREILDLL